MDPSVDYPFFWGYESENTTSNINAVIKLDKVDCVNYLSKLDTVLDKIKSFDPDAQVIALGVDGVNGDPNGSSIVLKTTGGGFNLKPSDYKTIGVKIRKCIGPKPILVIQEGGYDDDQIPICIKMFLESLSYN